MYRISRVFEASSVAIVKIAGRVDDSDLESWAEFLEGLRNESTEWIILDFGEASRIGTGATELIVRLLARPVYLLNSPIAIRNMAESAGYSQQILEPKNSVSSDSGISEVRR